MEGHIANADNMDFSTTKRTVILTEKALMEKIMKLQKDRKETLQRARSLRDNVEFDE